MKFDFRSESFERKSISVIFVYNLMIGCCKKSKENYLKKAFEQRNREPGSKFHNKGRLVLTSLWTTGSWSPWTSFSLVCKCLKSNELIPYQEKSWCTDCINFCPFGSSEWKIFYDFILVMHINFLNYYKARSLVHLAKFSHLSNCGKATSSLELLNRK